MPDQEEIRSLRQILRDVEKGQSKQLAYSMVQNEKIENLEKKAVAHEKKLEKLTAYKWMSVGGLGGGLAALFKAIFHA